MHIFHKWSYIPDKRPCCYVSKKARKGKLRYCTGCPKKQHLSDFENPELWEDVGSQELWEKFVKMSESEVANA